MQTWILIIGGLVVLGIGLDLLRRMRNAGRHSYEMDMNMQRGLDKGDPLSGLITEEPESKADLAFPKGGARKIERGQQQAQAAQTRTTGKVEPRIRTQAPLEDTQKLRRTPTLASATPPATTKETEAIPMLMDTEEKADTTFSADDDLFMGGNSPILSKPRVIPRNPPQTSQEDGPREVIVINVMSRQPEGLAGARLLETVLACGLRYGDMNIFHCHLNETDDTTLFSMANIVKPGTFDLNSMQSFQTPGVSFFMSLPLQSSDKGSSKVSAMETFEKMLACAKKVAQQLNGELRDERRSVMTGQTIEHCRQRISEFSRLTLSRSGKFTT